jgi:hypothetical protein
MATIPRISLRVNLSENLAMATTTMVSILAYLPVSSSSSEESFEEMA